MPSSSNLKEMIINKVESEEVFNYMKKNKLTNDNEFYLVLDDSEIKYEINIEPVILTSSGSVTVTDSRIKDTSTAVFIPDISVNDLVSNLSVVCSQGSAIITGTTSYDIPGVLRVNI